VGAYCLVELGVAKVLLIVFCVSYLLVVLELLFMDLTALALLMLAVFMTVFFAVMREYARRKTEAPI
jgi:membrane protein implicated in regulation of membrane protease activity